MDSAAAFKAKTEAMFSKAQGQVDDIAREFVIGMATRVITTTRGFELQRPGKRKDKSTDIRYTPSGQLRGGWYVSYVPHDRPTYFKGGPESDYGAEPIAAITAFVRDAPIEARLYIQNAVGYGVIVKTAGAGTKHLLPDMWIEDAANSMHTVATEAKTKVMRGDV